LTEDVGFPAILQSHLDDCRRLALQHLGRIPGLKIFPPQGAFYVFFDVSAYLGKSHGGKPIRTSFELCEYLLDSRLVATVPGSAFGLEGYVRISFACDPDLLVRALERLSEGLLALA